MEITRLLFFIGSVLFIAVGILHLVVHFTQLNSKTTQKQVKLANSIFVMNKEVEVLNLWMGFSLMFGVLLFFLGIIDLISLYIIASNAFPSVLMCLSNMIILGVIIFSGFKYFGKMQIYGGFLGMFLFGIALGLVCSEFW